MIDTSNFMTKKLIKNIPFMIFIFILSYKSNSIWTNILLYDYSFNAFIRALIGILPIVCIYVIFASFFYINKYRKYMDSNINSKIGLFFAIAFGIFKFLLIICFIPIIYLIIYNIKIDILKVNTILNFIYIWLFEWILPFCCLSFCISYICIFIESKFLKYVFSIVLLLMTNINILNFGFLGTSENINEFREVFIRSIYIFDDLGMSIYSNLLGRVFSIHYIIDKIIIIIITLFTIYMANSNKHTKVWSKNLISTILFSIIFVVLVIINTKFINYENQERVYNLNNDNSIEIINYSMDLKLSNKLKNTAILDIKNVKDNNNSIKLILDNIFSINNIYINEKPTTYNIKNNIIELNTDEPMKKNENIEVKIEYSGYVYETDISGNYRYVTTPSKVLLPSKTLAWYPKIMSDSLVNFNIKIDYNGEIFSNLEEKSDGIFSGNCTDLSIYSTNYYKKNYNNIPVFAPDDINFEHLIEVETSVGTFDSEATKAEKLEIQSKLKNDKLDKIIFGRTYLRFIEPQSRAYDYIDNTLIIDIN